MENRLPREVEDPAATPAGPQNQALVAAAAAFSAGEPPEKPGLFDEVMPALARRWWLPSLFLVIGAASSWVLWAGHDADYEASGSLWVGVDAPGIDAEQGNGPMIAPAWGDLVDSWSVLDTAAIRAGLHIRTGLGVPSLLFENLVVGEPVTPGRYALEMLPGGSFRLLDNGSGEQVDSAGVGEPLGSALGISWTPDTLLLRPQFTYPFELRTARQAARDLRRRLSTSRADQGTLVRVSVLDKDPVLAARSVNAILTRTVQLAAELKRAQLDERTRILKEELDSAEVELSAAESDLRNFRVSTATLPAESLTGSGADRDPIFGRYFELRDMADALYADRVRIQEALTEASSGDVPIEMLEGVSAVQQSSELSAAVQELAEARAQLRSLQLRSPGDPEIATTQERIAFLERTTIPSVAGRVVTELQERESEARQDLTRTSAELTAIPPRAVEETRLRRRAVIADQVYRTLRQRYEEERIAAASSIAEIRILDQALPPDDPSHGPIIRVLGSLMFGTLILGLALALVLDRADPKVRDGRHVGELDLPLLGVIPEIKMKGGAPRPEAVARLQEAFRALRLNLASEHRGAGPLCVAVTSPGNSDGKSTVAANLATAFAEVGRNVLLIDADLVHGDLHSAFGSERSPGLSDVLAEEVDFTDAVVPSTFDELEFLPAGAHRDDAGRLLGSPAMQSLLAEASTRYDVILLDSPSLAARSDTLVLGTVIGNLLIVLRAGTTDRRAATERLAQLQALPTRVLGAVLNDLPPRGASVASRQAAQSPAARSRKLIKA